MTTYYADFDLTTGLNDGTDAANAWKTLADVLAGSNGTVPAFGDTVLCKGTDTISVTANFTVSNAGTAAGGHCKLIGVDASWANVGGSTRAIIDANNNAISALTFNNWDFGWFENFEIKNAGSSGTTYHGLSFITSNSAYCKFINIYSHNNYGNGFYFNTLCSYATIIKCRSSNNSVNGFYRPRVGTLVNCRSDNNTARGYDLYDDTLYGCVAHDNGTEGFFAYGLRGMFNCVSHSNITDGIESSYAVTSGHCVFGCRSTANGTGFRSTTGNILALMYCYGDNTTETAGPYEEILNDGANTLTLNGTDTDEGYVDSANDDFNLASDATYRREAIDIP